MVFNVFVPTISIQAMGSKAEIPAFSKEIPVEYGYVKTQIPQFWELYKPKLAVRVGVSGMVQELTLETQAFNKGYGSLDIQGCVPEELELPLKQIWSRWRQGGPKTRGRYFSGGFNQRWTSSTTQQLLYCEVCKISCASP
ncbi:hypothetical protein OUZ56_023726 [Daphnia magna]|uniref:Uncharacterized protein n=1 Tax=Daphnia magna TaxID=35525 RepID=A0ABR0AZG1_9CRUS|nr:hypothetical protein OUZ56_023726 [Daphnia magna]